MLTVYYVAATLLQSRRLSTILQKISTVKTKHGTIIVHQELPPYFYTTTGSHQRKLEISSVLSDQCVNYRTGNIGDLLLYSSNKRVVSIFPKQILDISGWVYVLPGRTHLPIQIKEYHHEIPFKERIYVLLEANYNTCQFKYKSNVLEIEQHGIPLAWHVSDRISILLETSETKLAFLLLTFIQNNITLENGIEIIRIESVDSIGEPYKIQNVKSVPETYAPLDMGLSKEELKESFMSRWRAHISMLCTFCEAVAQVKGSLQDISVRHPGSGVGAVKLAPASYSFAKQIKPSTESSGKSNNTEDMTTADCSSLSSNTNLLESPTLSGKSVSNLSTETSAAPDSTRLAADSTTTSMSSLRSLPTTPRRTFTTSSNSPIIKPPNVIIFSDSASSAETVKSALEHALISDRYTIHKLNFVDMVTPWLHQACLVVIHGNVPTHCTPLIMNYLLQTSGSLLCLCSDFIGSILPMFNTAEVRPNELVHCSYKSWKHVPLMHHVFCYQPTPSATQFSYDENTSSLRAIPESVEVTDNEGKKHLLKIDILGAEETWQTPSLLLVSLSNSTSKIVFSQVHLEIDPGQYEADDNKRQALEKSDKARMEILCDVLGNHLGLQCSTKQGVIEYEQGYFLGNHEIKQELLNKLKAQGNLDDNNVLKNGELSLKFCGKGVNPPKASQSLLPILVHACPKSFSTVEYFENLKTENIGRLVIFSEIMTSCMDLIEGVELTHGFTVIPFYQTKGRGRSKNTWLSPKGCAMFAIQLHIPLDSNLGKCLTLLQHIFSLAIVASICEQPNLEDLDIGIKWPNDIYANKTTKIAGILVTSTLINNKAICNIGCGINLYNKEPTTSVNDMISLLSKEKKIEISEINYEKYFSNVFNKLEEILQSIESGKVNDFYAQYYNYWLHSDAEVEVKSAENVTKQVKIKGIDSYGYLSVETVDGEIISLQPDGNSFDMMAGLIMPRI